MGVERWALKVSNWALATCVVAVGLSAAVLAIPALRGAVFAGTSGSPAYLPGEATDLPMAVYDSKPFTVVYIATTSCGACLRAQDAMLELTRAVSCLFLAGGGRVRHFGLRSGRWNRVRRSGRYRPGTPLLPRSRAIPGETSSHDPASRPKRSGSGGPRKRTGPGRFVQLLLSESSVAATHN